MRQSARRRAGLLAGAVLLCSGVPALAFSGALDSGPVCPSAAAACQVAAPAERPSAPSGLAMPVGHGDGWRQAFSDDFPGSRLDDEKWGRYSGEPGSDPGARWDPSRVAVADGVLTLTTAKAGKRWTSGGINNARALAARSGKYEVRMRADRAPGVNVVALLWPEDNSWPPEIDFVEDRDGDREDFGAALHYQAAGKHRQIDEAQQVDMTEWHTYGVEWRPGRVIYTLDGQEWARTDSKRVPKVPMGLAIQSNAVTKGKVKAGKNTPASSRVEVDWVVGYVPKA